MGISFHRKKAPFEDISNTIKWTKSNEATLLRILRMYHRYLLRAFARAKTKVATLISKSQKDMELQGSSDLAYGDLNFLLLFTVHTRATEEMYSYREFMTLFRQVAST